MVPEETERLKLSQKLLRLRGKYVGRPSRPELEGLGLEILGETHNPLSYIVLLPKKWTIRVDGNFTHIFDGKGNRRIGQYTAYLSKGRESQLEIL
jgi:hypothetical protein